MRVNLKFLSLLVALVCFSCTMQAATASRHLRACDAAIRAATLAEEDLILQPSEIFESFPELRWGMSFEDAKKAIERTGAHAAAPGGSKTELVWNSTFNGMMGRGAVHFKEGAGLDEILVGVYAFDKQKSVFESWLAKLIAKHGPTKEEMDNAILISKVWRLKKGFVIELRSLKDTDSPVVDIHWVKE